MMINFIMFCTVGRVGYEKGIKKTMNLRISSQVNKELVVAASLPTLFKMPFFNLI